MKKTFTREEFDAITNEIVMESMKEAETKGMSGGALMAYSMTYIVAFGHLKDKLFDNETDTVEIEKEIF